MHQGRSPQLHSTARAGAQALLLLLMQNASLDYNLPTQTLLQADIYVEAWEGHLKLPRIAATT